MNTNTTAVDWQTISEIIVEGKCVLFLGPEATVNYGDPARQKDFFNEILKKHAAEIHSYHEDDGLFVFSRREAIYDISIKVKKFYEKEYSSPMLEKLARLPFHFIVLLSPDTSLQKEMMQQGFAFLEDYYDTLKEHSPELPNFSTPPLLYHLLGVYHKPDTLIISHGQMYNYIRSFLGGTRLPQNIKTAINFENAKNLIFLGVNFDKWYFQLILNMLGVDTFSYNCFASIQSGATGLRTIWEKHFRINFVPHQIGEFVEKLYEVFPEERLRKSRSGQAARRYKPAQVTKFLSVAFNGTDFENFCLSHFEEVHNDFTPDQGKTARINRLLDYTRQHDQYEMLLELMKDENPVQFEKNAPYYE